MTWADLGLRYNIKPFRKESVQHYVTLPGWAADQYIHEPNTVLESLDVWKAVSATPFPSFYHDRNFKGADALRYCYGVIQRMGVKAGPDGVVRLRQEKPTTITFMADEREAPTEDGGERPPKMKPIRSLPEEKLEEENAEEPLMTNRKRKGVNQPEGQQEPFLLAIGGQAGPGGEEGGTGYLELPDYFNKYGGPPKEKRRARSSSSPMEDLPEPDIPLSEQVLEPRARRSARASLPSAGLGRLDTSQLDLGNLEEVVLEKPQGNRKRVQRSALGAQSPPSVRAGETWCPEADEAEAARAKAETARARADWEAKKKDIVGGPLNPTNEQAVELTSWLARETLTVVHGGGAGGDKEERAQAERGTIDSHATTDEETVKAQFKISSVKAGGAEARAQVDDGPDRDKEAGEDAALKKQGGAEGRELEEEEGEPMEGLEEERSAEVEGEKGEKPGEGEEDERERKKKEERERKKKERVKREKKDKKKKNKKKKRDQRKEEGQSKLGKSPLGEGLIKTAKKSGPDVAMEMALKVEDPLVQANVARTLRLNRGETDSKGSDSTLEEEEGGDDKERGSAKKEHAKEKEKVMGISLEEVRGPVVRWGSAPLIRRKVGK
jgi:hypothetical protein